jgi:hypothetical protein
MNPPSRAPEIFFGNFAPAFQKNASFLPRARKVQGKSRSTTLTNFGQACLIHNVCRFRQTAQAFQAF